MHEYNRYPMVTAEQLKNLKKRPTKVKMLVRDYIDGKFDLEHTSQILKDSFRCAV